MNSIIPDRQTFEEFFHPSEMRKVSFSTQDQVLVPFVPSIGHHVYGKLSLRRSLNDPQDTEKARKLLRVIETLTRGAESAAKIVGGELLEAQGEMIHVIIPSEDPNPKKLVTFAAALNDAVMGSVRQAAGDEFEGFSQAACWGPAIIIRSQSFGVLSEISLGNAANHPAKRLGKVPCVPSGHLAVPMDDLLAHGRSSEMGWVNIPVGSGILTDLIDEREYRELSEGFSKQASVSDFTFQERTLRPGLITATGSPSQFFGTSFRADMDGFSALVGESWSNGTVEALVTQFYSILQDADAFVRDYRFPVVPLPWAGDCATLAYPRESIQDYRESRSKLPIISTLDWMSSVVPSKYPKFRGISWAVGVAGGDVGNRSFGNVIVAELQGIRRTFQVAVGRGLTWSHEAEQSFGLNGEETAIFYPEDYRELDEKIRGCFKEYTNERGEVHSYFRKATNSALASARTQVEREMSNRLGSITVSSSEFGEIPKPKPHYYGPI